MLYMLPSAHPTPQPKRHLDRFGYFCTAQHRMSSGIPEYVLSPKIVPSHGAPGTLSNTWGSETPSNASFLGPTRVHNSNNILIGSAVIAQVLSECRRACCGMPFPLKIIPSCWEIWLPSNTWSLVHPTQHPKRHLEPQS